VATLLGGQLGEAAVMVDRAGGVLVHGAALAGRAATSVSFTLDRSGHLDPEADTALRCRPGSALPGRRPDCWRRRCRSLGAGLAPARERRRRDEAAFGEGRPVQRPGQRRWPGWHRGRRRHAAGRCRR
jgi:hypothetical protein